MQDISGMHLESQMPEGNNNNDGDSYVYCILILRTL